MNNKPVKGSRLAFAVTFETYTEESITAGDAEERGFILDAGTLRDCVPHVCHGFSRPYWCGHAEPDSTHGRPRWLTWHDYKSVNDGDSTDETRALHIPPGVTDASARRVARLFRVAVRP